jgi:protein PhnA
VTIQAQLIERAGSQCELCTATEELSAYDIPPNSGATVDTSVLLCSSCLGQLSDPTANSRHWYCLRESVWNEHTPVKVLTYRLLKALSAESWAQELLGQIYLDDAAQEWADAAGEDDGDTEVVIRDSNGTVLAEGDTVTLIKDLEVKGANFTAKRGTTVKDINLTDDARYVEGRVNGIRIVLVAAYLKKA